VACLYHTTTIHSDLATPTPTYLSKGACPNTFGLCSHSNTHPSPPLPRVLQLLRPLTNPPIDTPIHLTKSPHYDPPKYSPIQSPASQHPVPLISPIFLFFPNPTVTTLSFHEPPSPSYPHPSHPIPSPRLPPRIHPPNPPATTPHTIAQTPTSQPSLKERNLPSSQHQTSISEGEYLLRTGMSLVLRSSDVSSVGRRAEDTG